MKTSEEEEEGEREAEQEEEVSESSGEIGGGSDAVRSRVRVSGPWNDSLLAIDGSFGLKIGKTFTWQNSTKIC